MEQFALFVLTTRTCGHQYYGPKQMLYIQMEETFILLITKQNASYLLMKTFGRYNCHVPMSL